MKFRTPKYLRLAFLVAGLLGAAFSGNAQLSTPFTLQNYVTGLCMGVSGNSTTRGAALITWQCNGTPSQSWFQGNRTESGSTAGPGGYPAYTLVSMVSNSGLVAGVLDGYESDGYPLITWTQDPIVAPGSSVTANNQGWSMVPVAEKNGNQCYSILNAGVVRVTPYNLSVQNGSTAENTPIVIWQDNYTAPLPSYQVWCVVY